MRNYLYAALVLFVLATAVKMVLNAVFDNFKDLPEHNSWSAAEARGKGSLVGELGWRIETPSGGGPVPNILEAWVEERHLDTHHFVWFPGIRRLGGANVCILTANEPDLIARQFVASPPLADHCGSWTGADQTMYYFYFPDIRHDAFTIRYTKDRGKNTTTLYLSLKR